MKTLPNIPEYGTERFTHSGNATFVAEASDFGALRDRLAAGQEPMPGARVYGDACDFGFYLVSQRTGRKVLVTLVDEERDDEGDVLAWHYSSDESMDPPARVTIFND